MSFAAALFERGEGRRATVYADSAGIPTIGVGRNLRDKGLAPGEIDLLRDNDLAEAAADVQAIIGAAYANAGEVRQSALTVMRASLGPGTFREFVKMIAAAQAGDWATASNECHVTGWGADRNNENAAILASGDAPGWYQP